MRGDEDHGGRGFQAAQKIESGAGRQFDVQKQGVWRMGLDQVVGLLNRGGLAGDVDIGHGFEQPAQVAPCRGFIVDDQHT
ncbi:hypothetical protein D3C72_2024220 [compost metagenome]